MKPVDERIIGLDQRIVNQARLVWIGLRGGKKFADEYRREDVLKYKNNLQDDGFEPKTIDTKMRWILLAAFRSHPSPRNARPIKC